MTKREDDADNMTSRRSPQKLDQMLVCGVVFILYRLVMLFFIFYRLHQMLHQDTWHEGSTFDLLKLHQHDIRQAVSIRCERQKRQLGTSREH